VLLTGLGEQTATLRIGGVAQKVPLRSLAALWRGEFATFWRAPPGYTGALAGTTTPKTAAWLNDKLATLDVPPPAGRHASPEAVLRARVAAFQAAQGLKPDGIAGPATFMQINRALHIDEPRLLIDSVPAT
ncbi:MAG: Peptidoglycan-binding domain 1 protein, partial [Rhizobacter sp.]|nr:Peptidoglycan-binding domain 1 protein [Rhizobacter sp.]